MRVKVSSRPPNIRDGAIAQLGERLLCKQDVVSSDLIGSTNSYNERLKQQFVYNYIKVSLDYCSSVVQLAEHLTVNQRVVGSSPTAGAKKNFLMSFVTPDAKKHHL